MPNYFKARHDIDVDLMDDFFFLLFLKYAFKVDISDNRGLLFGISDISQKQIIEFLRI